MGAVAHSVPNFSGFIPFGYQNDCLHLIFNHDYSLYTPEILLSGSVGSAKSILCAHIAISHCLRWPGARIAISRQGLPDLKKTIYNEIVEHLEDSLIEGVHYTKRDNTADIRFSNGSEIIAVSFGDKKWGKVKSLKLSGIIIEEVSEFDDEFFAEGGGFKLFKGRLRRIWKVPENFLICATNPDEPEHFLYDYFIQGSSQYDSRYVFYSETVKNPYLDPVYVNQLRQDYSFLEAERYLRGKWISLEGKGIYHAYLPAKNDRKTYEVDPNAPIHLTLDFNVAEGKPMSACLFQHDYRGYHVYEESIIEGSNWVLDIFEDLNERDLLPKKQLIYIHGDATGNAKSANSLKSNYGLIKEWLSHRQFNYKVMVPKANPPIKTRHTTVNSLLNNDLNQIRLYIYDACPTVRKALKSTRFKKNTKIEDDSKYFQHVGTALGYGLCTWEKKIKAGQKDKRNYQR